MNDDGKSRKRVEWLGIAKGITAAALERRDWLRYACPGRRPDASETREALKGIAVLTKEIAGLVKEMERVERGGGIGVSVLLDNPTSLTMTFVAVLAIARFNGDVGRDTRGIHDLVDIVAGRDPEDALAVRNMFRDDFPLRPHVNILYAATLDDSACRLKESSLNKLLGQWCLPRLVSWPGGAKKCPTRTFSVSSKLYTPKLSAEAYPQRSLSKPRKSGTGKGYNFQSKGVHCRFGRVVSEVTDIQNLRTGGDSATTAFLLLPDSVMVAQQTLDLFV